MKCVCDQGVPAALAPTGVSVSHPKARLDEHALGQYPPAPKKNAWLRERTPRSSLDIGKRSALRSLEVRARDVVADAQSAEPVQ